FDLGIGGTEDFDVFACVSHVTPIASDADAHMEIEERALVGNCVTIHLECPAGYAWGINHGDTGVFMGSVPRGCHALCTACIHQLCGLLSGITGSCR
ncbi:MAG: hypothetical protein ACKPKO_39050, partial [Candidatus Fonsibacter sp.]